MRKVLLLGITLLVSGSVTLLFVSRPASSVQTKPTDENAAESPVPAASPDRTFASLKTAYNEAALVAVGEISRLPNSGRIVFRAREVWKGEWLANETGRGDVELTLPGSMTLVGKSALLFKFRTQKVDAQKVVLLDGDHLAGAPELTVSDLKRDLVPVAAPANQVAHTPARQGWRTTSREFDDTVARAGLSPTPSPLNAFAAPDALPPVNLGLVPTPAPRRSSNGEVDLTPRTLEQSAQDAVADRLRRMFDGEDVPRAPHRRRPAKS